MTRWLPILLLCGCVTKAPTKTVALMLTPFLPAPPPVPALAAISTTYEPGPALQAYRTEQGIVIYWTVQDTNVWAPQWSTNLVDWNCCAGHHSEIPPREFRKAGVRCTECRYFTDVTTDWTGLWFFRLRKQ